MTTEGHILINYYSITNSNIVTNHDTCWMGKFTLITNIRPRTYITIKHNVLKIQKRNVQPI